MRAEELRIGNYYNSVKFNKVVRLECSDFMELYHRCDGAALDEGYIAEMFEPILLTEEWLIKLGFVYNKIFHEYRYGSLQGWFNVYKEDNMFIFDLGVNKSDVVVKYVHQLQNLYFALTGKEIGLNN